MMRPRRSLVRSAACLLDDNALPEARDPLAARLYRWARQDLGAGDPYLLHLLVAAANAQIEATAAGDGPPCLATAYAQYQAARDAVIEIDTRAWPHLHRRLARDRNDVVAWEALRKHVERWARRDVGQFGAVAVDELVTDTCKLVAQSFAGSRGEDTIKGFVFNHYRNARRPYWRPACEPLDANLAAPEEPWSDPAEEANLAWALENLHSDDRAIILARYLDDEDYATLAARLQITVAAARVRLCRALQRLRALMLTADA